MLFSSPPALASPINSRMCAHCVSDCACVYIQQGQRAYDNRDDSVVVVHDSGSSAHITNRNSDWIDGTLEKCFVRVYGVNGEVDSPLIARARGDKEYHLVDGFKTTL